MIAIILSVQPKWCELIASGKKTVEVRKNSLDTPFKVYIYQTKTGYVSKSKENDILVPIQYGKVIGEFVCDRIYKYTTCDFKDGTDIDDETMTRMSCLSKDKISDYEISPGRFGVFGWHISNLKIYDKPKELSEFHKPCINPGSKICELCEFADFGNNDTLFPKCTNVLTRPPQSYCYVEELN